MQTLRELQLSFGAEVLDGAPAELAAAIRADGFGGERRMQVYRNNVFSSLTEALQAIYPVVRRLVGDGFFRHAAREYIRSYPSRSGNLHDFGCHFARFLAAFGGARSLRYLPDEARLEWTYHRVFHAADAHALDPTRLTRVPAERYGEIRLAVHPASRLLSSPYPILRIWQVNQDGETGESPVDLAEGGVRLLVIRRGLDVEIQSLSEGEFTLLRACKQARPLAEACERALAAEPQIDLGACLQTHVLAGTIVDFSLPAETVSTQLN